MRRGVVAVAVVCAVLAPAASASPARTPSPAAATAALGRYLHQLYGEIRGYWTCPGPARDGWVDCIAEVRAGSRWHQLDLSSRWRNGVIVFFTTTSRPTRSWVRAWSPYSRHYLLRSGEGQVPGSYR